LQAYTYPGTELDLFAIAVRWKAYWASVVAPFLGSCVLEVGAGIGGSVKPLLSAGPGIERLLLLEPDSRLIKSLRHEISSLSDPRVQAYGGTIADLLSNTSHADDASDGFQNSKFDTVLYIDVLEHIHDDAAELRRAAQVLVPNGRLIILAPAHQALFSAFDQAVGHYRRYSRRTVSVLVPEGMKLEAFSYLDSLGLILSLVNKLVLSSAAPTRTQIRFWDSCVIPLSRILDRLLGYRVGKTVVMICRKA
jgi:SAM-dependent methyltransferase